MRGQFEAANRRSAARAAADREIHDLGGRPRSPTLPSCRTTRAPRERRLSVRWRARTFRSPTWAGGCARGSGRRRISRRSHGRGTPKPISPSPAPSERHSWSGCERSSTTSRSASPTPDHWSLLSWVLAKPSTPASKGRRIPISGLPQPPPSRPSGSPIERATRWMREAEATLELRRDRPRAARALTEARDIARRLGALPLLRATEKLAERAGITLRVACRSRGCS